MTTYKLPIKLVGEITLATKDDLPKQNYWTGDNVITLSDTFKALGTATSNSSSAFRIGNMLYINIVVGVTGMTSTAAGAHSDWLSINFDAMGLKRPTWDTGATKYRVAMLTNTADTAQQNVGVFQFPSSSLGNDFKISHPAALNGNRVFYAQLFIPILGKFEEE